MRTFTFLLLSLFLVGIVSGQEPVSGKADKKEAAVKKKEEREAAMTRQYAATGKLIDGRHFVLEADYMRNSAVERKSVTSALNFIVVDSVSTVIQVGSIQAVGTNGVGGITGSGRITSWKAGKNEKGKTFTVYMTLSTNIGIYDVSMNVDYSGYSSASLSGLRSGTLQLEGNLVPEDSSRVFKGRLY
jgi:hypothetical protein